jgi:mercuric ion transport protein
MNSSPPIVTKKSVGLAGFAAFGACVACCAVPLLVAAGVGGSILASLAGYIRPGADLALAGLVGGGVLAVMAVRERSASAAGRERSCATDGGCGCGPVSEGSVFATTPGQETETIKERIAGAGLAFAVDEAGSK